MVVIYLFINFDEAKVGLVNCPGIELGQEKIFLENYLSRKNLFIYAFPVIH